MTNEKIGSFIAAMRKERNMTQEQLAEKLGISNRSISRWENGKTMPDWSLMESICRELNVSMSELLRGEKEAQTMEVRETVALMAALADREKERKAKELNEYLIPGSLLLALVLLWDWLPVAPMVLPLRLGLSGIGMGLLIMAVIINGRAHTLTPGELEVLSHKDTEVRMKKAQEMIQFARKYQKAERNQHRKAFEAIENALTEDEFAVFSMTGNAYQFDRNPGPWHVALVVTNKRLLLCGEYIRGRLLTAYTPEWLEREEIRSVEHTGRKIVIHAKQNTVTLEGEDLTTMVQKLKNSLQM